MKKRIPPRTRSASFIALAVLTLLAILVAPICAPLSTGGAKRSAYRRDQDRQQRQDGDSNKARRTRSRWNPFLHSLQFTLRRSFRGVNSHTAACVFPTFEVFLPSLVPMTVRAALHFHFSRERTIQKREVTRREDHSDDPPSDANL